jgi:hypothetical protein
MAMIQWTIPKHVNHVSQQDENFRGHHEVLTVCIYHPVQIRYHIMRIRREEENNKGYLLQQTTNLVAEKLQTRQC